MTDIAFSDIIGVIGVALVTGSYAWLQLHREFAGNIRYSLFNAVGAGMIIYSLVYDWNLSAFLIESVWVAVSLYGVWTGLRKQPENADGPTA